ncbi:unnamed protein product [marine sediment metagenome]|uniref:Uncharacterized protein n=1 Tax=marine sediment metagenome TaxID=412755 RepID=X0SYU9_9ZZZZ
MRTQMVGKDICYDFSAKGLMTDRNTLKAIFYAFDVDIVDETDMGFTALTDVRRRFLFTGEGEIQKIVELDVEGNKIVENNSERLLYGE